MFPLFAFIGYDYIGETNVVDVYIRFLRSKIDEVFGIKMIQIFAKGKGYGHTISGFYKPVADSSRSASVEEIVGDIAMLVIAAGSNS